MVSFSSISLLYQWLTYAQLYDLGFWKSLWLTIVKGLWYTLILVLTVIVPIIILALI